MVTLLYCLGTQW